MLSIWAQLGPQTTVHTVLKGSVRAPKGLPEENPVGDLTLLAAQCKHRGTLLRGQVFRSAPRVAQTTKIMRFTGE